MDKNIKEQIEDRNYYTFLDLNKIKNIINDLFTEEKLTRNINNI